MTIPTKIIINAVKREFGLHVSEVNQLDGYEDFNYSLMDCSNVRQLVVKIKRPSHNPDNPTSIVMQKAMRHLRLRGLRVQDIILSVDNKNYGVYDFGSPIGVRFLEVFTYLPGLSIAKATMTVLEMESIALDVGVLCGKITEALQSFSSNLEIQPIIWHPHNFLMFRKYEHLIEDAVLTGIIKEHFDTFEENFPVVKNKLRNGFIHCDLSTSNLIVDANNNLGFVDFEHICRSYIVFELAICIAYTMTRAVEIPADPILVARNLIDGFQRQFPLNSSEQNFLHLAVCARLVSSLLMATFQVTIQPQNRKYLFSQASKCPKLLVMLQTNRLC